MGRVSSCFPAPVPPLTADVRAPVLPCGTRSTRLKQISADIWIKWENKTKSPLKIRKWCTNDGSFISFSQILSRWNFSTCPLVKHLQFLGLNAVINRANTATALRVLWAVEETHINVTTQIHLWPCNTIPFCPCSYSPVSSNTTWSSPQWSHSLPPQQGAGALSVTLCKISSPRWL